jgi:hypothetical protein
MYLIPLAVWIQISENENPKSQIGLKDLANSNKNTEFVNPPEILKQSASACLTPISRNYL